MRAKLDLERMPMAEPGQDWNPSCLVDGRPRRRLIFGGRAADSWFIYFEQGGYALTRRLQSLRRETHGVVRDGSWAIATLAPDMAALKKQLDRSNEATGR